MNRGDQVLDANGDLWEVLIEPYEGTDGPYLGVFLSTTEAKTWQSMAKPIVVWEGGGEYWAS